MKRSMDLAAVLAVTLFSFACASSSGVVDMKEAKRFVGTEENVRIDAQMFGDKISPNQVVQIAYEITNQRQEPIAIADLVAESTYDPESRTVTVNFGTEVPGNELVPRLLMIPSGGHKSFTTGAKIPAVNIGTGPLNPIPRYLQIRVSFIRDTKPFEKLLDISERSIHDPQLASELFPKWVESTENVSTNAIPIYWTRVGDGSANVGRGGGGME